MLEIHADIRPIRTQETYPLRLKLLRPGMPLPAAQFAEDERATHFGCFVDDNLIGIVTIFPQPLAGETKTAWQLRGMAVDKGYQGRSCGEQLVRACCDFARSHGAQIIWCNARLDASGFYLKQGFALRGEQFIIADAGPHYVMWKSVV